VPVQANTVVLTPRFRVKGPAGHCAEDVCMWYNRLRAHPSYIEAQEPPKKKNKKCARSKGARKRAFYGN
jgi:hypothetical protein